MYHAFYYVFMLDVEIFLNIYIYILILGNNVARKVKPAMFSCKIITNVITYNPMFCISMRNLATELCFTLFRNIWD